MNDASLSASDHIPQHYDHDAHDAHAIASAAAVPAISNDDSAQQKRRRQREQRAAFLDHLIRNIDIIFYCQLSILYYMECVCQSSNNAYLTSTTSLTSYQSLPIQIPYTCVTALVLFYS